MRDSSRDQIYQERFKQNIANYMKRINKDVMGLTGTNKRLMHVLKVL